MASKSQKQDEDATPYLCATPVDASSCANVEAWRVTHYSFDWVVDLEARRIRGTATLSVERRVPDGSASSNNHEEGGHLNPSTQNTKPVPLLILDAHASLNIASVRAASSFGDDAEETSPTSKAAPFDSEPYCVFGERLAIDLSSMNSERTRVIITYETSGEPAVTWLSGAQTATGSPMCFSMGQACLNRSLFPCQDAPKTRATFDARFRTVPSDKDLVVVCAAERKTTVPTPEGATTNVFFFEMPQSLPSYLTAAFVVGKLESRRIGPRSHIYAEPDLIDAAANEFSQKGDIIEKYLATGERLFGPYRWVTYDVVVLPKSFAYGGMENPRLTFLSPTLIVGDGSLTDTIAHEIAHSWFGNLVTNVSWGQFFLNEGFTMYAQRRITEEVHGASFTALEAKVGWKLLESAIKEAKDPALTALHVPLPLNVDPDDTYNDVPYEKGYAFLECLRDRVGTKNLDAWLRKYVDDFAFECVVTSDMTRHLLESFPDLAHSDDLDFRVWFEGRGLPPFSPDFSASRELTEPADRLLASALELDHRTTLQQASAFQDFRTWPTYQQAYLLDEWLSRFDDEPKNGSRRTKITNITQETDALLHFADAAGLRDTNNCELSMRWSLLVLAAGLETALPDVARHLERTGKLKFTLPVYRGFIKSQPRCVIDAFADDVFRRTASFLDVGVAARVKDILSTPMADAGVSSSSSGLNNNNVVPGEGWASIRRVACVGCPKC